MEVVFDDMIMMQFETFFLLFCRAKHVRLVEAEQMPLSPFSKTWQNISRALILATKLESFQKLQLRNGKCYFEKSFKVILQCLFKVMTSIHWTCFKVFFVQRCILKSTSINIYLHCLEQTRVFNIRFSFIIPLSQEEAVGAKMHFFIAPPLLPGKWQLYGTGFSYLLQK